MLFLKTTYTGGFFSCPQIHACTMCELRA